MNLSSISDRHKILFLYLSFLIGLGMGCIVTPFAQTVAFIGVTAALVFAYVFESQAQKGDLLEHHSVYMIRTIWIWSGFLFVMLNGASIEIQLNGDVTAIQGLVDRVYGGDIPTMIEMSEAGRTYIMDNYDLFVRTCMTWAAPVQVYGVYRVAKGLARAVKGYRLKNLRSWF